MHALPAVPSDDDFEMILGAVRETARGRWFLDEYAARNRHADTDRVMAALARLEGLMARPVAAVVMPPPAAASPPAGLTQELGAMADAIARTRAEIAALRPAGAAGRTADASDELDAIVAQTETATSEILAAAETIQEIAWTLRETGFEPEVCDVLDAKATAIYTACSFQDLTGQRTRKVIEALSFVERRVDGMMAIWGHGPAPLEDARSDERALLAGPARPGEGLDQGDVDVVMAVPGRRLPAPVDAVVPAPETGSVEAAPWLAAATVRGGTGGSPHGGTGGSPRADFAAGEVLDLSSDLQMVDEPVGAENSPPGQTDAMAAQAASPEAALSEAALSEPRLSDALSSDIDGGAPDLDQPPADQATPFAAEVGSADAGDVSATASGADGDAVTGPAVDGAAAGADEDTAEAAAPSPLPAVAARTDLGLTWPEGAGHEYAFVEGAAGGMDLAPAAPDATATERAAAAPEAVAPAAEAAPLAPPLALDDGFDAFATLPPAEPAGLPLAASHAVSPGATAGAAVPPPADRSAAAPAGQPAPVAGRLFERAVPPRPLPPRAEPAAPSAIERLAAERPNPPRIVLGAPRESVPADKPLRPLAPPAEDPLAVLDRLSPEERLALFA